MIHVDRLLRLAEFLDRVPENRFDFSRWIGEGWEGDPAMCGTTACAIGHACFMPEFRKLGATLNRFGLPSLVGDPYSDASDVGSEIFGLDREEFSSLFVPGYGLDDDATAAQVAARIREFCCV